MKLNLDKPENKSGSLGGFYLKVSCVNNKDAVTCMGPLGALSGYTKSNKRIENIFDLM